MSVSRINPPGPPAMPVKQNLTANKDGTQVPDALFAMILAAASAGPLVPPPPAGDLPALADAPRTGEPGMVTALTGQQTLPGLEPPTGMAELVSQGGTPPGPALSPPPLAADGAKIATIVLPPGTAAPENPDSFPAMVSASPLTPSGQRSPALQPTPGALGVKPDAPSAGAEVAPPVTLPGAAPQLRRVPAPATEPAANTPAPEASLSSAAIATAATGMEAAPAPVAALHEQHRDSREEAGEPEPVTQLTGHSPLPDRLSNAAPVSEPIQSLPAQQAVSLDQVADRVAGMVRTAPDGRYTVTLHLNPEHLGEVRLQIHVAGTQVETVFTAAAPEVRQALTDQGDQLRQHLNQAGLTLSGFLVSTGEGGRQPSARQQMEELLQSRRHPRPADREPITGSALPRQFAAGGKHKGILDTIA